MNRTGTLLVCNAGSSNLKAGLFAAVDGTPLASWQQAWTVDDQTSVRAAVQTLLTEVNRADVVAVGHRVVHGGSRFTRAVVIDADVREEIAALSDLAPLHNPLALAVIDAVSSVLPGAPQVAAFDTAFHSTLPPAAFLYPLPYAWYEAWGIRRFGFHGLSHASSAARAAEMLGQPLDALRLVTCHLGSGCSLAAISQGRSVATTMGFTPLDGIMMATRPGALDPGILIYVLRQKGMTAAALEAALTRESGLKGVSGISGDMRDILAARATGHPRAALAFDLYVARLREGIAAMAAGMGGLDALVFTGGVGENASVVRAAATDAFAWIGIALDAAANGAATPDTCISAPDSSVPVLVIHAREEAMVARETIRVLRDQAHPESRRG